MMIKGYIYGLIAGTMMLSFQVSAKSSSWVPSSSLAGAAKNSVLSIRGGGPRNKNAPAAPPVSPAPPAPPVASMPALLNADTAKKCLCALGGTMATFYLNNEKGMGPVRAASICALVSTIVLPGPLAVACFCGGLAGMSKTGVVPGGLAASAVLGILNGIMLSLFDQQKLILGYGGRLGVIACLSCVLFFIADSHIIPSLIGSASEDSKAAAALFGDSASSKELLDQLPLIIALTTKGAFKMRVWKWLLSSTKSKRLSTPLAAVGATGLSAAFYLPTPKAASVVMGAFTAMAGPKILPSYVALFWASVFAAVFNQATAGILLGGFGGKLGVCGFMGCVLYKLLAEPVKPKEA